MSDEHRVQTDFGAAAELKRSPSIAGQRNASAKFPSPYTLKKDTLFECLREFMSKPISQRHLYEIHTLRRGPSETKIISSDEATELAARGAGSQINAADPSLGRDTKSIALAIVGRTTSVGGSPVQRLLLRLGQRSSLLASLLRH